jgi:hypothetical protein
LALGGVLFEENFDNRERWEIVLDTDKPTTRHFAVGTGRFKGVNFTDQHNVVVKYLPDGTIQYKEKGIIFADNGEIVTWSGHGLGRPNNLGGYNGGGSYVFNYKARLETGNNNKKKKKKERIFALLDNVIGVYELRSDKEGNGTQKWYEWKTE